MGQGQGAYCECHCEPLEAMEGPQLTPLASFNTSLASACNFWFATRGVLKHRMAKGVGCGPPQSATRMQPAITWVDFMEAF